MPTMTDDELALMNELLTSQMGLWFPDHKREILESRLGPRIAELRLRSVLDYYVLLQQDAGNGRHENPTRGWKARLFGCISESG